jgi:hypothetical protein
VKLPADIGSLKRKKGLRLAEHPASSIKKLFTTWGVPRISEPRKIYKISKMGPLILKIEKTGGLVHTLFTGSEIIVGSVSGPSKQ